MIWANEMLLVDKNDAMEAVKLAQEYSGQIDNRDAFITGVGMELALTLVGLWPEKEE
ncbi:MAG: hypothetical protein LIO94_07905 [Clostridiales bacterium]|nr:hypothetical protein [Clostridiales bacterium]